MRTWTWAWFWGAWAAGLIAGQGALSPEQQALLPAAVDRAVGFREDVQPILEAACVKCHGRGQAKGGFSLEDRTAVLRGGDSGPAVVPGESGRSYLIELVSGLNPEEVMPIKGSRLKAEQVGVLRAWIDQGLGWEEGVRFGKVAPLNLAPRQPALPAGSAAGAHPVDRWIEEYWGARGVAPGEVVSDRVYARRVFLDVVGLLPNPAELAAFEAEVGRDKRERLVRRLLADDRGYAEHWLTFWNDLLRNDYKGTGYIDGGREQITGWLYAALASNMRFDRFVRELVNPVPESAGFAKGIVWRGVVNASQTPQMQAAQNIAQVFLGVNLKCASCHDSFINDYTLADAYGMASVYADAPLEMVHCDKPTGKAAEVRFLYPELGAIDQDASKAERLEQLARIMTGPQNGRLTRTVVNRLWARLMGRGLVEPVDEMDGPAWHAELLDWLAEDLVSSGYDLRKTIERILTSRAYQLPAVAVGEQAEDSYVFRGPLVRRLSAEQYVDALAGITGVWQEEPAAQVDFQAGRDAGSKAAGTGSARWIWSEAGSAEKAAAATRYFRRELVLESVPERAAVAITCDNRFKLFVNGKEVASSGDYTKPRLVNVRSHLVAGRNVVAVEGTNDRARPGEAGAEQGNPAGLLFQAVLTWARTEGGALVARTEAVSSDGSWVWSADREEGWTGVGFEGRGWESVAVLGEVGMAPWNLEAAWSRAVASAGVVGQVRAALVDNSPLMAALGRPNREQVTTTRASAATTLQALELTNGAGLASWLKRGAEALIARGPGGPRELVIDVFERAVGRRPSAEEQDLGVELVGDPVRREGVEDFLWTVSLLPEFQLIY